MDGANIEIREAVGEENFFLFGLHADEIEATRAQYDPDAMIEADSDLRAVMGLLETGHFDLGDAGIFDPICAAIRDPDDQWLTAADFPAFVAAQQSVDREFKNLQSWTRRSILNTAASGRFSSDRTIAEYAKDIWKL